MWPFDGLFTTLVDLSPLYNLVLGIGLMIIGLLAFRFVPGKTLSTLAGITITGIGFAVALGYWVIL